MSDNHRKLTTDVVIIGAGASGLFCAMEALKRHRRVVIIEQSNKPGRKILMSGGGKCNFTNLHCQPEAFLSQNPHFCKSALKRFTPQDFISMVEKHKIAYEEKKHSQLFCINSSKDILNMLLAECNDLGVQILTDIDVESVKKLEAADQGMRYQIVTQSKLNQSIISCISLVVATGALSIPTLGGSGFGYELAKQFKLPLVPRHASLVPFMFTESIKNICEQLSGVSTYVMISCNKKSFEESMLFTHRGISGPVVLQISNYWHPGDEIYINLMPNINAQDILLTEKDKHNKITLQKYLNYHLPKALVLQLQELWWSIHKDKPLSEISNAELRSIGNRLNSWNLKPSSTEGYRTAEVTWGGVDTNAIDSKTMEARNHPGLYFIGEVVDVTGHLGGYNFQWAWSSGYSAGLVA